MVNLEQLPDLLKISYVNKEGNIELLGLEVPSDEQFKWEYSTGTGSKKAISWDGKPVKKVPSKFLNKYRLTEFLASQPQDIQDDLFNSNTPNMFFLDIETEILDEFPSAENPKSKIYCVSIADQKNNITVLGIKELSGKNIDNITQKLNNHFKDFGAILKFTYIKYETEFDMLYTLLKKYIKKMPLISGWNFTGFDWPYIVARSQKLGIDVGICSPTGQLVDVQLPYTDKKNINVKLPIHKIIVDYLQVYKKWDNVVATKESDSLDYVSEQTLGVQKVHYPGTLTDLYRDNFEDYIFYNAVDSHLVRLIHEKINAVSPYLTLSNLTRVEHYKAFSSMTMIDNILCLELLQHKKVLVYGKESAIKEKFKGAFVFPIVPGFHDWLITLDYASLYPTTIRQHNISPEVFLGKIDKVPKELNEDIIYCASGATFKKNEPGALPILMTKIYKDRKEAKKKYGDYEAEIKALKDILKKK